MKLRPATDEDVQKILDCFSGGDTSFASFKVLVEEMDHRAANGDEAATALIKIVRDFARLIRTAEKVCRGNVR